MLAIAISVAMGLDKLHLDTVIFALVIFTGVALVLRRREEGMRLKDAVRAVADDTGLSRNALYDAALKNLA